MALLSNCKFKFSIFEALNNQGIQILTSKSEGTAQNFLLQKNTTHQKLTLLPLNSSFAEHLFLLGHKCNHIFCGAHHIKGNKTTCFRIFN